MCLIVFSFKDKSPFFKQNNSSEKEFVLLANRDEFYDRPTLSMQWWGEKRNILSGQDKLGGGTWFGVTKKGKFAAITNFREKKEKKLINSRGELVLNYLKDESVSAENYISNVNKNDYAGFNLILGNKKQVIYISNRYHRPINLTQGLHILANNNLNSPTEKVKKTKRDFEELLKNPFESRKAIEFMNSDQSSEEKILIENLKKDKQEEIPFRFIKSKVYGTRSTTLFSFDSEGTFEITEQNYTKQGKKLNINEFRFNT